MTGVPDSLRQILGDRPLVVVSNREPYEHRHSARGVMVHRPAGGLVAALDPVLRAVGGTWVAWGSGDADFDVADTSGCVAVPPDAPRYTLRRVALDPADVRAFYYGYANQALWPLCHMALGQARFSRSHWEAYRRVNRRFAEAAAEAAPPGALVWVHDYHLALCPQMIREIRPDACVMTFWHIPWPAWDVFRACPQRVELLEGLLGADLVGVQHPRHVSHFLECAERELGASPDREAGAVVYRRRRTAVRAFPISVDFAALDRIARSPACEQWMGRLQQRYGLAGRLVALGVDRLDYTKGIPERLRALRQLLARRPHYRGRLVFVQKSAPSRTAIPAYRDLQQQVEAEIARINDRYGTAQWRPVLYLPEPLPLEGMAALYRMADVCVVSSLADGMNLVAKEFVACQVDRRGVLVCSELAGAHDELPWAVSINPYDTEGTADALERALEMDPEERLVRMTHLRAAVRDRDVYAWVGDHLRAGLRVMATRAATWRLRDHRKDVAAALAGRPLAVLLDFDGTLAPLAESPALAALPEQVRGTLARLSAGRAALVAVISGRALDDVRERVGLPGLVYAGNHGLEISADDRWVHPDAHAVRPAVAACARRLRERLADVPGVLVEDKGLSASVHYRSAPHPLVERVRTAVFEEAVRASGALTVRPAHRALEIRPQVEWDKGSAARQILRRLFGERWEERVAVVCVGDDQTDEDLFAAMPPGAVTVRVGADPAATTARFVARDADEVREFLAWLVEEASRAG
ncbi:MAG: bifunctional alpha,alpha-trehalose-phosphate synthase (UDP-forming)/trehalose-phosphatase [Armatimonadota bacterium]|nr:bifunctional alpha,alpha-trehalose-phosphate synthase (UDP-forming)/trehalose-phosphatase [Armatimonadota bacterium]